MPLFPQKDDGEITAQIIMFINYVMFNNIEVLDVVNTNKRLFRSRIQRGINFRL